MPRRKPEAKPPIKVPAYFTAALKKNKKALAAFEEISAESQARISRVAYGGED